MKITSSYSDITDWFFQTLQTCLEKQKIVTILLPGGHSLDEWYISLLPDTRWNTVDKSIFRWWLVDERVVSSDNPDRNDIQVWRKFLEPAGFEMIQCIGLWLPVDALEYTEKIGTPDMAIFWLWPDGHIASLFPEHPALQCMAEGYITLYDSPKPPSTRITLTVPSIQKIPHTALFSVGPEKQAAFENFLDSHKTLLDCPAKILHPEIIYHL